MARKNKQRLTWSGNRLAQREADTAFRSCRNKKVVNKGEKRTIIKRAKLPLFTGTYHAYLRSPQWRFKRNQALKHYGRKCHVCKRRDNLQVHHKTYARLFQEEMKDLLVVCDGCHSNIHEGKNNIVADPMTSEFLSVVRGF